MVPWRMRDPAPACERAEPFVESDAAEPASPNGTRRPVLAEIRVPVIADNCATHKNLQIKAWLHGIDASTSITATRELAK